MVERETFIQATLDKARGFAAELAQWDSRIVQVFAIGSLTEGDFNLESKIDLVCTFDPEPVSDSSGYFWVVNLLVRDEYEGLSRKLGLENPFDLGFTIGEHVYLPGGEIISTPEEHIVLWSEGKR